MLEHHAHLLYAERLEDAALPGEYKMQSVDVLHFIRERFSIDDARELTTLSQQTPFEAQRRVFVVYSHSIAVEAQNALLKLFEEPPKHAQFYLVVPRTISLLPTLRSRLSLEDPTVPNYEPSEAFTSFVNAPYGERMELIATNVKDKNQAWIEAILQGAEAKASKEAKSNAALLEAVLQARTYIATRGASGKMLLEAVALCL